MMKNATKPLRYISRTYQIVGPGGLKKLEQFRIMTKEEYKSMIDQFPDDTEFLVLETDFTAKRKISKRGELFNKSDVLIMAKKSKTIIFSGNQYISHIDLHSIRQPDIFNIKKMGVMNTIMLES